MSQIDELKNNGLKATLPRLKILEVFQSGAQRHMTAEDVFRHLLLENTDIGLATVYRVLTQFEQAGILSRNHFESGKAVYELNEGQHHDHLVCLDCGRVEEFFDAEIERRHRRARARAGGAAPAHLVPPRAGLRLGVDGDWDKLRAALAAVLLCASASATGAATAAVGEHHGGDRVCGAGSSRDADESADARRVALIERAVVENPRDRSGSNARGRAGQNIIGKHRRSRSQAAERFDGGAIRIQSADLQAHYVRSHILNHRVVDALHAESGDLDVRRCSKHVRRDEQIDQARPAGVGRAIDLEFRVGEIHVAAAADRTHAGGPHDETDHRRAAGVVEIEAVDVDGWRGSLDRQRGVAGKDRLAAGHVESPAADADGLREQT